MRGRVGASQAEGTDVWVPMNNGQANQRFRLETATCPVKLPPDCNLRIVSKTAGGQETTTLPRVAGTQNQFSPLTLSVESLDNEPLTGLSYRWSGPNNLAATSAIVQASARGEYTVVVAVPGLSRTCEVTTTLSATPCQSRTPTYTGCRTVSITSTTAANQLTTLVPGDYFYAGDYRVDVSDATLQNNVWTGEGSIDITLMSGIKLPVRVRLDGVALNDCYEMTGGTVRTLYDPNWGNVVSVDDIIGTIENIKQTYRELQEFLKVYDGSAASQAKLAEFRSRLEAHEREINENNNVQPATKTFYTNLLDNTQQTLSCAPPTLGNSVVNSLPNARQATNTCSLTDLQSQVNQQETQLKQLVWVALPDEGSPNESLQDCIARIDYRELNREPAAGSQTVTLILTRNGAEVERTTATIRGKFYRILRNGVEYFYAEKQSFCNGQTVVLIHEYGNAANGTYDGLYSYYDFEQKQYVPFVPLNYPSETMSQMVRRMGPGLATFADVTEAVFVNTLTFIAGGGPVGSTLQIGKVLQGIQWGAFAYEQVKAVYPGWDAQTKEWFGKANWALLAVQVGLSIAEIRQMKTLSKTQQDAAETIARQFTEGEIGGVIAQARQYAETLPPNHPFRIYISRLANRLSANTLGKYATRIDDYVELLPQEALFGKNAQNFLDKVYRTVKPKKEIILFRSFGHPDAKINGSYAATFRGATREELAILTKWGNSMRFEVKIKVPAGKTINIGRAAPQPIPPETSTENLIGLGEQAFLPFQWELNWVEEIVDKQTGQVYRSVAEFKNRFPELFFP